MSPEEFGEGRTRGPERAVGSESTERAVSADGAADSRAAEALWKSPDAEPGPGEARTAVEAWDSPGRFHVERDSLGRVTSLEGWLSLREGERPASETRVQQETRDSFRMDRHQDSGHILGYVIGGPCAAECSEALARANQVPMDSRINRSQIAGIEAQVRERLASGDQVYARASLQYSGDAKQPRGIEYAFLQRSGTGGPEPHPLLAGSWTRLDDRPGATTAQAVRATTGERAADFYSPFRKGADGTRHQGGH